MYQRNFISSHFVRMQRRMENIEREKLRDREKERKRETRSAVIIRHNQNVLMQFFSDSVCHLIKGTFAINTFSILKSDRYTLTEFTSLYMSLGHCIFFVSIKFWLNFLRLHLPHTR